MNEHNPKTAFVAPGISQSRDGQYRWQYTMPMWRNPTILFTVWKVLGLAVGFVAIFMFLLELGTGIAQAGKLLLTFLLYGIIGATILLAIAYALLTLLYGGKYEVEFTMDEKGVQHRHMLKSRQDLGKADMLLGALLQRPTLFGTGMLASTRTSAYSEFKSVKRIVAKRQRQTIHLRATFRRNQVYANDEQFDFVLDYLMRHCPKAKLKP